MGLFYFCIGQLFLFSLTATIPRSQRLRKIRLCFSFCYMLVVDKLLFCSTYLHSESTFRSYYSLGRGKRTMVELQDDFQSFCMEVVVVTSAYISLVKASHMAKFDGNGMGNTKFF